MELCPSGLILKGQEGNDLLREGNIFSLVFFPTLSNGVQLLFAQVMGERERGFKVISLHGYRDWQVQICRAGWKCRQDFYIIVLRQNSFFSSFVQWQYHSQWGLSQA